MGTVDTTGGVEADEDDEVEEKPAKEKNKMPREIITIECTEARKEGKSPSRYTTTRNKKTKTEKLEIKKYNPALRRRTVHREIK